ncbi:MAG: hypothetical protein ACR2IJ_10650 [Fluviibacter sp.]
MKRHPGYIIGNHWLEAAYERICTGEEVNAVLAEYGWVRMEFVNAATEMEREACAKVCEEIESHHTIRWRVEHDSDLQGRATGAAECAEAIRARGQA